MSKGDFVEVHIDGVPSPFRLEATQNGRRIEVGFETAQRVTWLSIAELTRGGTVVAEGRFPVDKIIAYRVSKKVVE